MFRLSAHHVFPDPELAEPSGLLGVGGDLSPERVLLGYRSGIFPWYSDPQPYLWWSPDPRFVLPIEELYVRRSLAKRIRQARFRVTLDTAFTEVLTSCARSPRPGQDATWITADMIETYRELHRRGHAHSVEAWDDEGLAGGLYGVAVGGVFSGESMFSVRPDASKVAFVHLVRQLARWGFGLVDSQVYTEHLESFGAREVPRSWYLERLGALSTVVHPPGRWSFDSDFACRG